MLRVCAAACLLAAVRAAELPSCDSDTDAHCVGEGADLSKEGIEACLEGLGEKRSARCSSYLEVMKSCSADITGDGACASAAMDGETMPCLMQRVKPEQLSEACQGALPKDDLKGLAKFWKDGKRMLDINEIADLNADDKDTYNRWKKKKGGAKSAKAKERDYAIKTQKKEQTVKQVTNAVHARLSGGEGELTMEHATKLAKEEAKTALESDMTGTLKPFSKGEIAGIAKEALKLAKMAKSEL